MLQTNKLGSLRSYIYIVQHQQDIIAIISEQNKYQIINELSKRIS